MVEKETRNLGDIIKSGVQWNEGLFTVIVDLCNRVEKLENKKS